MKIYDLVEEMARSHKSIFDMPLRVTFYARVSTKRDEQLNSQENQIQTFTDMINNNPNWTLVDGYVDTIRGESAANRDNFIRMVDDAKNGEFELIICKEISRFSRDMLDSIKYTRELLRYDVGVYFSSDGLCTIDRDAELRLGIMASIAQQEVARLSERIKFGHQKAIANGVVMGNSRIIGYRKENKRLVIDEEEAKMVRLIFNLFSTEQYSLRQLESELYNRGYRSLANTKISHNTIKSIIMNPKYKGYYCGNKVKVMDYRTKKQKFLPPEEWLQYKDETGKIVPVIVDEELWDKCNKILSGKIKSHNGNKQGVKATSALSGMIICSHCGVPFYHNSYGHGTKQGVRYHWICKNKKPKSSNCPTFPIRDEEIYEILNKFFKLFATDVDEYIDDYIDIFNKSSRVETLSKQINDLNKQIEKLQKRKQKILDLYTDDLITKNDFVAENSKIVKQLDEFEGELSELGNSNNRKDEAIKRMNDIRKYFHTTFNSNKSLSNEAIDSLCKTLIEKIMVSSISNKEMDISIILKTGDKSDYTVTSSRANNGQPFGTITKKMIPISQQRYYRRNVVGETIYYQVSLEIV